jgi:hypothetical protein
VQWLLSLRLVWFMVAAFAVALTYMFWRPITEERIAQAGALLQLVGIGIGFWAWSATRKLFKMPSFMDEVRAWIARRPRNLTLQITGTAVGISVGSGKMSLWHAMGPELDAAKRTEAMVANIEQLRKEAGESNAEHMAAVARLRTDMESKTRAIEDGLFGTSRTLRESQTGGLWAAWVALVMLFVGTALNGFPGFFCWLV